MPNIYDPVNGSPADVTVTPLNLALVSDTRVYLAIPGPDGGSVWARLCEGVTAFTYNANDTTQQYQFMCGGGYAANEQTGRAPTIDVEGRRVLGDPAQEYVCSLAYSLGNFVFGGNTAPRDRDTVILQFTVKRAVDGDISLEGWEAIPCSLSSTPINSQPRRVCRLERHLRSFLRKVCSVCFWSE